MSETDEVPWGRDARKSAYSPPEPRMLHIRDLLITILAPELQSQTDELADQILKDLFVAGLVIVPRGAS